MVERTEYPKGEPFSVASYGGPGRQAAPDFLSLKQVTFSLQVFPIKHYQDKIRPYIQLPSHRNITGIVEVILGESKAYVFFEKDFGDMHSYVRSRKRLREEEAARLFKQIVSAVAHCHQSAIVLGDLKLRKFVFSTEER